MSSFVQTRTGIKAFYRINLFPAFNIKSTFKLLFIFPTTGSFPTSCILSKLNQNFQTSSVTFHLQPELTILAGTFNFRGTEIFPFFILRIRGPLDRTSRPGTVLVLARPQDGTGPSSNFWGRALKTPFVPRELKLIINNLLH